MEQIRKPVHPGAVFFQDVLVPLKLTITDAARMMGVTRKTLSDFIHEQSACTPQMALRIAQATLTSAESWLTMQIKLDLWEARQKISIPLHRFPTIPV